MDTESLHMLVTKDQLTLYDLELSPAGSKEGRLSMHAHAGLKEDKRIDGELAFERIPVASWIPKSWDGRFHGQAKGRVRWEGESAKLETSRGEGDVRMDGLRYADANILQQLATATGREELRTLHFETFHTSVKWKYPNVEIYDLEIEARGVLRVEGRITINSHKLGGKIELGVRAEYLAWLPKATEEIFTRSRDGYHWTTVHFSGTLGQPREDLSERVRETIKESPGAMLGLWFREAGAWLDRAFGG
jgi:hypothetical protein